MIVVPPHLVIQWAGEIQKYSAIPQVFIYFGDSRDKETLSKYRTIDKLTRDHPVFTGANPQRNMIISSYFTMAIRHGPTKQRYWQIKNHRPADSMEISDTTWPFSMTGMFGCLVMDEAHQVRNMETLQWRTMRWLHAPMNVLLTATPTFNSIEDIRGLMPFLLNPTNEQWWDNVTVPEGYDPFVSSDPDHQCHRLMYTLRGLDQWIWKNDNVNGAAVGLRLKPIFQKCVIRRLVTSLLPLRTGTKIGDSIPPAFRFNKTVRFGARELDEYNNYAQHFLRSLIARTRQGRIIWRSDMLRLLQILTTYIPLILNEKMMLANKASRLEKQLDSEGRLGRYIVWTILKKAQKVLRERINVQEEKQEDTDDLEEGIHEVPAKWSDVTREQALCYLLAGAPKIRSMLQIIRQEVLLLDEKSIVWCCNPAQQWYIASVLNTPGIPCAVYHADLTHSQRHSLQESFNTDPNTIKVLICSYYVNSAGSNMQQNCRNVHLFDVPNNDNLLKQAIGRVRRLGQYRAVKVYNYILEQSFNMRQIANNLSKAVPALGLFLNREAWDITLNEATGDIDMGCWYLNDDQTISRVADVYLPYLNPRAFIDPDVLCQKIISSHASTSALIRNRPALSDLEIMVHEHIGALKDVQQEEFTESNIAALLAEILL
jgi:hypothetical protein